jgi:hypothetical protein
MTGRIREEGKDARAVPHRHNDVKRLTAKPN